MRHVIGIGLAIGLAAAIFFAAGWGYLRLLRVPVPGGGPATLPAGGGELLHDANVLWAVAALAGTALLAGILVAAPRVSPLAPGLPGLVLIAWTVGYGFSVSRAVGVIPLRADAFGAGFEAMLINGLLAAAGLVLAVPLFIPSRWRSRARRVPGYAGLPGYAEFPGHATGAAPGQPSSGTISLIDDWTDTAPYPVHDPYRPNNN
jgi:hypothetical protein